MDSCRFLDFISRQVIRAWGGAGARAPRSLDAPPEAARTVQCRARHRAPTRSPPIAQLLARKPWLIPRVVSGDIPEEA